MSALLKLSLKRGALVTAANWQVVIVQFVADTLFKTLVAVPIVGGLVLVVVGNLRGWRWVNRLGWRAAHLAAIAVVVIALRV